MTSRELDIATTAAVITADLFDDIRFAFNIGYIDTIDTIGRYAIDFVDQYEGTNWEEVFEDPKAYGFGDDILCWDEAVLGFVRNKIEESTL